MSILKFTSFESQEEPHNSQADCHRDLHRPSLSYYCPRLSILSESENIFRDTPILI